MEDRYTKDKIQLLLSKYLKKYDKYSYVNSVSKKCKAMYLSNRAYASIVSEVMAHDPYETGVVFLGHVKDGKWYIVEAIDPGVNTKHSICHHEMDKEYQNHIFTVLSRVYKCDLDLLGLCHRHPGAMNIFSSDDNMTNKKFADAIGNGTISVLVNLTPDMKFTCYYLDPEKNDTYFNVPLYIGDEYFKDTEYLDYIV